MNPISGNIGQFIDGAHCARLETQDTQQEMEDEFETVDLDADDLAEAQALLAPKSYTYPSANGALITELTHRMESGALEKNPKEILGFVAHNTNPRWLEFSWNNLLDALKECYEKLSFSPLVNIVFSQNCVHCTRAVDQTLQQMLAYRKESAESLTLAQVDQGGADVFYAIHGAVDEKAFSSRDSHDGRYLETLRTLVSPGERACIAVPVTSAKGQFSHAMNLVNLGPAEKGSADRAFILCGQTGRVYDLLDDADVQAFYARHSNTDPDVGKIDVKYALPSDVANGSLSLKHILMAQDAATDHSVAQAGDRSGPLGQQPPRDAVLV